MLEKLFYNPKYQFPDVGLRRAFAKNRIASFVNTLRVWPNARIADLGGRPAHWNDAPIQIVVDCLNLPSEISVMRIDSESFHGSMLPCDITQPLRSLCTYDFIYCNSVLEHISDENGRRMAAQNIINSGKPYWVQVPSPKFPIEHHCRVPFWWNLSERQRDRFLKYWEETWPFKANQMTNTYAISFRQLKDLFPAAEIRFERLCGLEKSIIAFSRACC